MHSSGSKPGSAAGGAKGAKGTAPAAPAADDDDDSAVASALTLAEKQNLEATASLVRLF
jgi:hypothetical protein